MCYKQNIERLSGIQKDKTLRHYFIFVPIVVIKKAFVKSILKNSLHFKYFENVYLHYKRYVKKKIMQWNKVIILSI